MEGSFESRVNVLQSVHHLKGPRGLSADDLANHTNTAFLGPMEVFFNRLSTIYLGRGRGSVFVSSSRTMNDDVSLISEFSIFRKLCFFNTTKAQGSDGILGWLLKENE